MIEIEIVNEPLFLCAAGLFDGENPGVSARTVPPVVFGSIASKVHTVVIARRDHRRLLALSRRLNATQIPSQILLIYLRAAPNGSASRIDA